MSPTLTAIVGAALLACSVVLSIAAGIIITILTHRPKTAFHDSLCWVGYTITITAAVTGLSAVAVIAGSLP